MKTQSHNCGITCRRLHWRLCCIALGIAATTASAQFGYTVSEFSSYQQLYTTSAFNLLLAEQQAWALSNTASELNCGGVEPLQSGEEIIYPRSPTLPGKRTFQLDAALYGYTFERLRPDYYLGQTVEPPDDVDWTATYQQFLVDCAADPNLASQLFFDLGSSSFYFASGGGVAITWVMSDGSQQVQAYNVSPVAASRPYRLFWTSYPYNANPVDLSGEFVKLYGSPALLQVEQGPITNYSAQSGMTVTTGIVSGVYLDNSMGQNLYLQAAGTLHGQFLLAYYDSGTYERLLDVLVVEVCAPVMKQQSVHVGDRLFPSGDGYNIEGLHIYQLSTDEPSDGFGAYLYQHRGQYSYSPKNNAVFSIRPTTSPTISLAEIYWAETDSQNISWPFECNHYLSTWSLDTPQFVRGNLAEKGGALIYIPEPYVAELMAYQEPDHARIDSTDKAIYSTQSGYALLKLQADDNIWFQPLHSVMNTSYAITTNVVAVGTELRPPVAISEQIATTVPAYLYREGSSRNYNPNIYIPPAADSDPELPTSALYFVNTNGDNSTPLLEAWWYLRVQQDGMPVPLEIPSLPAWYQATWPAIYAAPQIVLSSQLGGSGNSLRRDAETGELVTLPNEEIMADETPIIYTQNDVNQIGYNPNEEHAIICKGGTGYVPWAIRCDLNTSNSSQPAVLTQYVQDNCYKMSLYHVVLTNELYATLGANTSVGTVLPGPHPLDLLPNPWLRQTYWDAPGVGSPAFRDRKGVVWTRCNGEINIRMFYPMQAGFWFPELAATAQPALDTAIPWLVRIENPAANLLTGTPLRWTWQVEWPESVPEMSIGQTLTKPVHGLPEVWAAKSVGVVYPEPESAASTLLLYDPTVIQSSGFAAGVQPITDFGFEPGDHGNVMIRQGKYYFRNLPPTISDRFFYNPSADIGQCLCLKGQLQESAAGADILFVNVLNHTERTALKDIVNTTSANKQLWDQAIECLATEPVEPSITSIQSDDEMKIDYEAVDHYALTAIGSPDYVVLIENDAVNEATGVKPGDAISMHVIKVKPELYAGRVVTRQDPNNLLSQQLDILYTEMLAGCSDDFIFEWKRASPNANGTIPQDFDNLYTAYGEPEAGRTRFTLGTQGSTLSDLVNTYYAMRYHAKPGTPAYAAIGAAWSPWCGPALAEGWVQRVLNAITPFAQRMRDLYENEAETAVSMIEQIGRPYEGDVALNQDNLTSVGLIQLYQTVLDKAESLSIALGINNSDANKQLLLAVERLADLYMLLGNEAYSDAVNPTISIGSNFILGGVNYGSLASSLYCFENQVDSLLDEELALLRGRSLANAPANQVGPFYHRLLWNFTKGITAGEVAYVMNYGITEKTGDAVLDENDAAIMYPQGHGDAWGHYLSALKGYYRLLRNPHFSWGEVSMSEMNLADLPVNVDYDDESRFAQVAAALTKAGVDIVDRTARKVWAEDGAVGAGYLDADTNRAFGYGEWGTRTGLGAFYNWAVANSILPPATDSGLEGEWDDKGLLNIHRSSVHELTALAAHHRVLQQQVDRLDQGVNPLGFSEHALPFDISAQGLAEGISSHFEQIYERAVTALNNAGHVLDKAQSFGNALRQIEDSAADYTASLSNQERSYNDQLITIFGYPYEGDIGSSGTYAQGYNGPDLFHYMWMDLQPFGLSEMVTQAVYTNTLYVTVESAYGENILGPNMVYSITNSETIYQLSYQHSANGLIVKPESVTGTRRAAGRVQMAYIDFIQTYLEVLQKEEWQQRTADNVNHAIADFSASAPEAAYQSALETLLTLKQLTTTAYGFSVVSRIGEAGAAISEGIASVWDGGVFTAAAKTVFITLSSAFRGVQYAAQLVSEGVEYQKSIVEIKSKIEALKHEYGTQVEAMCDKALAAIDNHALAVYEMNNAWAAMLEASENIETIVAEGQRLLEAREQTRLQAVSQLTGTRYNDMFFRLIRNESLTHYTTAFDLAQQYAWLAARAYDYETGRLSADAAAGADFLGQIVAARSIGSLNNSGQPNLTGESGDPGLADILARMAANWQVLKLRLGINNPQPYTTWFSLRHGLFRIVPGSEGNVAWSTELTKHWVDNILELPEFKRYCLAFNPAQAQEPGLVIPFATTIETGKNLFGQRLAGGDSAYDSTYFATKIAAAGVRFVNYNALVPGASIQPQLAQTPLVYLMPLGTDRMRDPGNLATVLDYPVLDQVMQPPFAIGSQSLESSDWSTIYNSLLGVTDGTLTIRRYPSFRASISVSDTPEISEASKRLVGRSVWNTRWVLVIPAAALGSDREAALTTFIKGRDVNRDGQLDQLPVSDIEIGLRTYSNSGN